ncbi:MAG: signal peptidase I [Pseudomonadota bacterium]
MESTHDPQPAPQSSEATSERGERSQNEFASLAMIALLALGLALFVRIIFVQPYNIPSASMAPTLLTGDFILVGKSPYGYSRASLVWPFTRLPVHGRLLASKPKRGDIIVFKNKKDGNRDYIKRIIGLPGEEIRLLEGRVLIDGGVLARDFLGTDRATCDGQQRDVPIWRESLPNGVTYVVQECAGDDGRLDTKGPYRVPRGHYFVMGDNRDQSQDSRVTAYVGTVPFDDIVGKADRIMISINGAGRAPWQVWAWPSAFRGARVLKPVN